MNIDKFNILLIFFILVFITSCIGSSVSSIAGNAALTEKGIKAYISDKVIYSKIKTSLAKVNLRSITDLKVNVNQGEVLVVGSIKSNEERLMIIRTIWKINGVKQVFNEIHVNQDYNINDRAYDIFLMSKIKTSILFNSDVLSNNYSIDVYMGTVYLIGVSRNLEESEIVESHIKNITGVKKLISFITLSKNILKSSN